MNIANSQISFHFILSFHSHKHLQLRKAVGSGVFCWAARQSLASAPAAPLQASNYNTWFSFAHYFDFCPILKDLKGVKQGNN